MSVATETRLDSAIDAATSRLLELQHPGGFERPAGRLAVHLPERARRQQQVGVAALAE